VTAGAAAIRCGRYVAELLELEQLTLGLAAHEALGTVGG
jgi:hypothetical protein